MYPLSFVDADGELRYNVNQDGQLSKMSLLIYLNEGFAGGETTFFTTEERERERREGDSEEEGEGEREREKDVVAVSKVEVVPRRGDAVVFWHGDHPLSPYHEGVCVCVCVCILFVCVYSLCMC